MNFATVPLDLLAVRGITPDTHPPRPVILVVDDEVTIAESLRTILMQFGYASFAVYDAASALDMIRVFPPDLLLTDFVLPGINGLELAKQVSAICPQCKVIVFSGLVSAVDMTSMSRERNPAFVMLEKPMHPALLVSRIEQLLQASTTATRAAG